MWRDDRAARARGRRRAGRAAGGAAAARADDASRVFDAPPDRVFTVTGSVLTRLGWDVDKEDRDVGWIVTDSRRLDDDNKTGDRSVEKRILDRIGRSL